MKLPSFYSLPPVGQKIPASKIWAEMEGFNKHATEEFLEPIRKYLDAKYLLFLNLGRTSLWLLLKALSNIHPERKEVIIPAYTCPAIASAILKAGLIPVLCDNNLEDFGFSIEDLEEKVNKNTLAIVIVHLFGYPANLLEVKTKFEKHDIFVIEDSAQSFGNLFKDLGDKKLGGIGDGSIFSFGRGKPISILHGGLLVTQSEIIYEEALKIYLHFISPDGQRDFYYRFLLNLYSIFSNPYLYWIPQKIPLFHLGETIFEPDFEVSRGCALATSIIGRMLERLEVEKEIRRENSKWYSNNLGENPFGRDDDYPYLRFPFFVKGRESRYHLLHKLTSYGTGAAQFYPCPLNELKGLREILNDNKLYPNAKKIADTLITLPVHSGVTSKIREKIKNIVLSNGIRK